MESYENYGDTDKLWQVLTAEDFDENESFFLRSMWARSWLIHHLLVPFVISQPHFCRRRQIDDFNPNKPVTTYVICSIIVLGNVDSNIGQVWTSIDAGTGGRSQIKDIIHPHRTSERKYFVSHVKTRPTVVKFWSYSRLASRIPSSYAGPLFVMSTPVDDFEMIHALSQAVNVKVRAPHFVHAL